MAEPGPVAQVRDSPSISLWQICHALQKWAEIQALAIASDSFHPVNAVCSTSLSLVRESRLRPI
jgi:hypothetical protein